jgi:LPS-assembly protein
LVNRFYAERFKARDYFVTNMYYFQDMRPGTRLTEPLIAPEIQYTACGDPGALWGGRWSFDSSLLVTSRKEETDLDKLGPSTRRLALKSGWERQFISQTGFLTTLAGQVRTDAYWAENVYNDSDVADVEYIRPFAQADLQVRYPLGRRGDGYEQLLEPIAVLSVAPRARNDKRLPNEDSLDIEFDETNLFSSNRFSGIDRVEGGTRAAYGLRHALFGHDGERIEMLVGQVFRSQEDDTFTEGSGLQNNFSDFVGHVDFTPANWLDVSYGFRLNQRTLGVTRQELTASAGALIFRPNIKYLSLKQSEGSSIVDQRIQEATVGLSSQFAKYWSFSASHRRAMAPNPGPRNTSFNLVYQDECFRSDLSVTRDYTDQVDVEPGTTILLNFYLKNIGGVNTNY